MSLCIPSLRKEFRLGYLLDHFVGLISIAITFFNKAVFSSYDFNGSNTLTLAQGIFSLVFLITLKHFKMIDYSDFSVETAKKVRNLTQNFEY